MPNWNYTPTPATTQSYDLIPEGDYRVKIQEVEAKTFSTGNEGWNITLKVAGEKSRLFHNLALDPSDPEKTNKRLTDFFDSFQITDYDLSACDKWIGKDGGARVRHSEWNGETRAQVRFFLNRYKVDKLEPWPDEAAAAVAAELDDDELPF